jgi:hypothetical protein
MKCFTQYVLGQRLGKEAAFLGFDAICHIAVVHDLDEQRVSRTDLTVAEVCLDPCVVTAYVEWVWERWEVYLGDKGRCRKFDQHETLAETVVFVACV